MLKPDPDRRDPVAGAPSIDSTFDKTFMLGVDTFRAIELRLQTTEDVNQLVMGFLHGASIAVADSQHPGLDDDGLLAAQAEVLGTLGAHLILAGNRLKDAARKPVPPYDPLN